MFFSNIFHGLAKFISRLLTLLGLRQRRQHWGTVYDSVTKQPLDPVLVKLIRVETGEVVGTRVTDMSGRYSFLASPGRYKILAKKSNYLFPSKLAAGGNDNVFDNLYHGEFFDLSGDSDVVAFNIPLDPLQPDWNQQAKLKVVRFYPFLEDFFGRLTAVLFWFLLILAVINFFTSYSLPSQVILVFYALVFALAIFVPRPRLWGRVWLSAAHQPLAQGSLELSHEKIPAVVVARSQVFEDGKFFLRVEPGKYLLKVKTTLPSGQESILKTGKLRVSQDGLVDRNIVV